MDLEEAEEDEELAKADGSDPATVMYMRGYSTEF